MYVPDCTLRHQSVWLVSSILEQEGHDTMRWDIVATE